MKVRTFHGCVAAMAACGLVVRGLAEEQPQGGSDDQPKNGSWTLSTDDTELTLSASSNALAIVKLRNPAQSWNWTPAPSRVPLPGVVGKPELPWTFREASATRTNGLCLTLRFTCAEPALEMRSVWRALPGPGPVENEVSIENRSAGEVAFGPDLAAAAVELAAQAAVTLHRADKTAVGTGKVYEDVIGPNAQFSTGTGIIPLVILGAGATQGVYFGFEWELGGFRVTSQADPLRLRLSAHPITENVARAKGEVFLIPSVYYGVYQGDMDDGANRFKRWFWNHKITRSLHDNDNEPWVEVCMQDLGGNGSSSITGLTPQSVYDRLAATGVECVKMDFWDGSGQCWYTDRDWMFRPQIWPNGFDFAAKAHKAGVKASLYMGGTYKDADLTTLAGRDAELEAVLTRYDKGWFDMWRTDRYTAPNDPMPSTYQGVANFLHIQDHLIRNRPGYRYENCCNGGPYKGFAICRRMTFCTMNDLDQNPVATRTTYYSCTYGVNPVQLKSDLGPANTPYLMRTHMLGAILSWAADNPVYRQHLALYKSRQRPILRGGNVYHILPMADGVNWDGLQFFNPDLNAGSVMLFKPSAKAADGDSKVIKLKGLDRKATYTLTFQDRTHLNCAKSGAQLMDEGIAVSGMTGDLASEIIWINWPDLAVKPDAARFSSEPKGTPPAPQKLAIAYANGPNLTGAFKAAADAPWVSLAPVSGAGDGQVVALSVNPQGLPSGLHRARVTVSRADLPEKVVVPVVLRVEGARQVAGLTVAPAGGAVAIGAKVRFSAAGVDQFGEPYAPEIAWSVTGGGTMDNDGVFTCLGPAGDYVVSGTVKESPAERVSVTLKAVPPQLACWRFDEGSGGTAADAWGGHTGTLVGGATWVPGKKGGAIRFSGEGQYVDTQTHFQDLNLPFSIAFWVNPAAKQGTYADIFGNHLGSAVGMVLQQDNDKANQYSFGYGATPEPGGAGTLALTAGQWQHVAVVCDGAAVILYRDGVEVARGAGKHPPAPNPGRTFWLGQGFQGSGRFFNGALDDFRIYRTALSPAEVRAVMQE